MLKSKKIIVVLSVVLILVSCFVIPASAVDNSYYRLDGDYLIENIETGLIGTAPDIYLPNTTFKFRKSTDNKKFEIMYTAHGITMAKNIYRYIKFDVIMPDFDKVYDFSMKCDFLNYMEYQNVIFHETRSQILYRNEQGSVTQGEELPILTFHISNVLGGSKVTVYISFFNYDSLNAYYFTFYDLTVDEVGGGGAYEEQQAQNSGNDSVDGAMSAVPDETQGFSSALSDFVESMSYTGTDASWSLPPITIPAISGVIQETQLTDNLKIDFGQAIRDYIPENVLKLVQFLLTIALIVYCVKELYGIISYIMTLKGGGMSNG